MRIVNNIVGLLTVGISLRLVVGGGMLRLKIMKCTYGEIEMPEYKVGLDSCICKNPNVKSKFRVLSRSSKAIGFMMYSPEFGMFSCARVYVYKVA